MTTDLAKLIPLPLKTAPDGTRLDRYQWVWPAGGEYDATVKPLLPAGWKLYSTLCLDGYVNGKPEDWLRLAGKDFGASRDDERACVLGMRTDEGAPRDLLAIVKTTAGYQRQELVFAAGELPAACRWCDEQLAARAAS